MKSVVAEEANEQSRAQLAYDTIKRAILRWDLEPEARIIELQLTTRYEFGRAAVRAALTRLAHEKLVAAIPRQGYMVAPITFKQIQDLYAMRLILEPASARMAAVRSDPAQIAELERLNDACEHRPGQENLDLLREANRKFHLQLAIAADNELLIASIDGLFDSMQRILYLPQVVNVWNPIDATSEHHRRVIDAIVARDPATAESAMQAHVQYNRDFFVESLISSPALSAIRLTRSALG